MAHVHGYPDNAAEWADDLLGRGAGDPDMHGYPYETKAYYFTFGQNHAHSAAGRTYDKDCVVKIEAEDSNAARQVMFDTFGVYWAMQYDELPNMDYYPRGVFEL